MALGLAPPMKHSHPNRWIYGGMLRGVEWSADAGRLRTWNGSVVDVQQGDTVLALFTGAPAVVFVGAVRDGEMVEPDSPGIEA